MFASRTPGLVMLMLVTLAIELALAVLKLDNEPAKILSIPWCAQEGADGRADRPARVFACMRTQRARIGKVPFLAFAAPKLEFVTGC